MRHVMVDIETLGQSAGCVIASIGACKFDETKTGDKFFVKVDLDDAVFHGLRLDSGTLRWWLTQTTAAARLATFDERGAVGLSPALKGFSDFIHGTKYLWSHGAAFDIPILDYAYRILGEKPPWLYWYARDTRTLFGMVANKGLKVDVLSDGEKHNPLDDAVRQALMVQDAHLKLGLGMEK